ncbi:hypothetical protein H6G36_27120 [Anabaena minutissima FACHB-250]|nr:hypothetical protein [Anabaena minutissima FACHB-250]
MRHSSSQSEDFDSYTEFASQSDGQLTVTGLTANQFGLDIAKLSPGAR